MTPLATPDSLPHSPSKRPALRSPHAAAANMRPPATKRPRPSARSGPLPDSLHHSMPPTSQALPKSVQPGILAPGPAAGTMGLPANYVLAGVTPEPWPVLPYLDTLEHLLRDPAQQPLTFHRRVTRPLSHFLSAVMLRMKLKDASHLGMGMLLMRALIRDDCYGRLAFYDILVGFAGRGDWQGVFICCLEYLEAAGFDPSKVVTSVLDQPAQPAPTRA